MGDIEKILTEYNGHTFSQDQIDFILSHFISKNSSEYKKLEEKAWMYDDLCK